ncbi:hypothetical protein TNIN_427621 [Trichonephila inaurata madagascariensis]|uniref:Uncharacterized protein n=1 Tax=Trichonephila inaurata madagascariensis TaxID=2747483 RepID=A0A8X7BW73_9ARAC|nr:hypothetical protein TNIN_427621 [Trichonephila inaurata madagascariensis]
MNLIRSKFHSIKQNKLALSYKDDKRFINDDGITTLAHGHWSLMDLDLFNEQKTTQLSNRRKQLNSAAGGKQLNPLNSKTKTIVGEKQLNIAAGGKQFNSAPPLQQNRLFLSTEVIMDPRVGWFTMSMPIEELRINGFEMIEELEGI